MCQNRGMNAQRADQPIGGSLLNRVNTDFESAFSVAAAVAASLGFTDESLEAAKHVLSHNPNSELVQKLYPDFGVIVDKLSSVVEAQAAIIREDPDSIDPWIVLGNCYLSIGDYPNALAAYCHALRIRELDEPYSLYYLGIIYQHFGYVDQAIEAFEKSTSLTNDFEFSSNLKYRYAFLLRAKKEYNKSTEILNGLIDNLPMGLMEDDIKCQIAYNYQLDGNSQSAEKIYQSLIIKYPDSLKMKYQYAWFLYVQGTRTHLETAEDIIKSGLNISFNDPYLLLIGARVAMKRNDLAEAYQRYRSCISYWNDSSYFWCGLGALYFKNDQCNDASIAFQRALTHDPGLVEAWLNLGLIFEQQGDVGAVIRLYQTGMMKCPNSSELLDRFHYFSSIQGRNLKRSQGIETLIDTDESRFRHQVPEEESRKYIDYVPPIPGRFVGVPDGGYPFEAFVTNPKSLFVDE